MPLGITIVLSLYSKIKPILLYKLMGEPKKPEPKAKRGKFREVSYEDVILSTEEMLVKMIQFYREDD